MHAVYVVQAKCIIFVLNRGIFLFICARFIKKVPKSVFFTLLLVPIRAVGPKDNQAENKPGTSDLPTNSSKAKRFKKSKKLAANHKQKADNDQTDKDYIGTATLPNHPRQGKRSSDTLVTKTPATGQDPDLETGNKVDVKTEVEPTNDTENNINVLSGFKVNKMNKCNF